MTDVLQSVRRFLPELVLAGALMLVVLVDSTRIRGRDGVQRLFTAGSLLAALVLCARLYGWSGEIFSGMLVIDPMAVFFKVLLVAASLLVVVIFTFDNSRE